MIYLCCMPIADAAAGASDDYARGGAGIKYAFTVELSPTDDSPHGFLLPPHHIEK